MIKVSIMYPATAGSRFDHEYYRDVHMPLLKSRMGDSCIAYSIDKGIAGGTPDSPPVYVGLCHIYCQSVQAFQQGFGPHAKEIMSDIKNYTDILPVIQISEVAVAAAGVEDH
ncbi:EthD family reductase [Solimonas soli]|uniref:EthD family reductase n=1 Tax=Solimonas soli TaxID=413479 RepID=UPI000483DFED|nr:EthD family reductase [Solimonas soli]